MYIMSVLLTKIIILCSKYWISQNLFQNLIRYISDIPDISDISDILDKSDVSDISDTTMNLQQKQI